MNLHHAISRTAQGYRLSLPGREPSEHRRRRDALSHAARELHPRQRDR